MARGAEATEEGTAVKINNEVYVILVGPLCVSKKARGKFWKDQAFYLFDPEMNILFNWGFLIINGS